MTKIREHKKIVLILDGAKGKTEIYVESPMTGKDVDATLNLNGDKQKITLKDGNIIVRPVRRK